MYSPVKVSLLWAVILASCATADEGHSADSGTADSAPASIDADTRCVDGTPCGDQNESACDRADICVDGACSANFTPVDEPCGDQESTACNQPDSCDGAGGCSANLVALGTACGSNADVTCDHPDSCDGNGFCVENHEASGTSCGDQAVTECTGADACDGFGLCSAKNLTDNSLCDDCDDGPGWCTSCLNGACQNLCSPSSPITTTFADDNGLHGNMFDLTIKSDLRIVGFDLSLAAVNAGGGPHSVNVYYKLGSYVGFEQAPGSWTLLGTTTVDSLGDSQPTPLPLNLDLSLSAGASVAFYITTSGTIMRYSTGSTEGALYTSDSHIDVFEGTGNSQNFGSTLAPRVFNGTIHYRVCE